MWMYIQNDSFCWKYYNIDLGSGLVNSAVLLWLTLSYYFCGYCRLLKYCYRRREKEIVFDVGVLLLYFTIFEYKCKILNDAKSQILRKGAVTSNKYWFGCIPGRWSTCRASMIHMLSFMVWVLLPTTQNLPIVNHDRSKIRFTTLTPGSWTYSYCREYFDSLISFYNNILSEFILFTWAIWIDCRIIM